MKLLKSANVLSGPANFKIPPGQYQSLILRVSGTNQAGQTLSSANLGLITATWRGTSFMSVRYDDLNVLNQMTGGVQENASAIGAAFAITCRVNASYSLDGNIFDITDDDDVNISVDLSGVTGVIVASGNVQLFGTMQAGAQAYVPKLNYFVQAVPANGSFPEDIPQDNCTHLLLKVLTNIARIQVEKDHAPMVQCTLADALATSNNDWRLETALTTAVLIPLQRSGIYSEAMSDDVRLTLDAGAGGAVACRVTAISIDPTPDVLARSRATLDSKIAVTKQRKNDLGKVRATKVEDAIQQ